MRNGFLLKSLFVLLGIVALMVGAAHAQNAVVNRAVPDGVNTLNAAQDLAVEVVNGAEVVAGEILLAFRPGAAAAQAEAVRKGLGAKEIKVFWEIGARHWRLPPGLGVAQAVQVLSRNPNVLYAEPNYILHALAFPSDPLRGDLWNLHNIGQTGGKADADIDAPDAWEVTTGTGEVVVGVIDSGVDYNHEDLAANMWKNPGEIPGNGIDDDANGYVDDVYGWDFYNDDNDPMDDNSHGTHCSGTIGAVGNNGIGVVGVNWNVKIMALKFLGAGGSGSTSDAISAILYAASFNVRITNNSWGGGSPSKALQTAIANSGALFVAAAGNSGSSRKMYPAAYALDNIISVAAADHNDNLASFSNYGSDWVDLGAPGVNILSTVPYDYDYKSGTSMAAPHVAGAVALVMASNSGLSNDAVKAQILATVDLLPSLQGKMVSGGRLNVRAALGAPELPDSAPPDPVTDLQVTEVAINSIVLSWTATGDDGNDGTAYLYDLRYLANEEITEANWETATQAQGEPIPVVSGSPETFKVTDLSGGTTYSFALKVADKAGNYSLFSNCVTAATPGSPWSVETVDSAGRVGLYNALAYDTDGNPAIGYSDSDNNKAKFAHWNGTSWDIQVVGDGGSGIDLAYDPSGRPTLSYGSGGKLNFARWNGSSWDITVIEARNAYNDVTSLAYDPSGNPSISYRTTGKQAALKLARWTGTSWQTQVVEAGAGARYSSLAYDAVGYPSIAYSDDVDKDNWLETLKFAHWNGASSQIQIVETGVVGFGVFASLAYEPTTGCPAIAHKGDPGYWARFARWNGTSWEIETFDGSPYSGAGCSLAYDSSGTAFISYHNYEQVKLAQRSETGWKIELVESIYADWRTSLKFNGTALPSLSYFDYGNYDLKFARKVSAP